MGACCCGGVDKVSPQQMDDLEKKSKLDYNAVTTAKKRSPTDIFFILLLLVFTAVLTWLLYHCYRHGDIDRLIRGYDSCGNICGKKNSFEVAESGCVGQDMTSKNYLKLLSTSSTDDVDHTRECVDTCDNMLIILNRCLNSQTEDSNKQNYLEKFGVKNFLAEVSVDLSMTWRELVYLALISFGFSLVLLLLFRFLVGLMVWIVLIGVMVASFAGTVYLWILWGQSKSDDKQDTFNTDGKESNTTMLLILAIVSTIVTLVIFLVLIVMRKRIKLVIQLFKEAGKAVAAMPLILLEPIMTFLFLAVIISFWFFSCLIIESGGTFKYVPERSVTLEKDTLMQVTRWYNLLALFWFIQFGFGCQHMIIAGAVGKWFFTRDKSHLGLPILRSFKNLVFYHLGTVAFGSMIIALIQLLRAFLKFVEYTLKRYNNTCTNCLLKCCQCCLLCFEHCLQYLSRNAYIETAIYGYSFCNAGKQAFKHLASNALRVAAINSVGDFVLFLGKVLVVISTVLVGVHMINKIPGVQHSWVPLSLAGIFAYLVSHCFITVYEMAIDTIFLCFCEDCEINDGLTKPYYMSRGLMQFVQNSKRALAIESGKTKEAWSGTSNVVPTISKEIES